MIMLLLNTLLLCGMDYTDLTTPPARSRVRAHMHTHGIRTPFLKQVSAMALYYQIFFLNRSIFVPRYCSGLRVDL